MISVIEDLKMVWAVLFPEAPAPADRQWARWLLVHDQQTVREGMAALTKKFEKLQRRMDPDFMIKYMSSVTNRITRERASTQEQNQKRN